MGSGVTIAAPSPAPPPHDKLRHRFLSRRYVIGGALVLLLVIALAFLIRYSGGSERRLYEASLRSALGRGVTAEGGVCYDSSRYPASLRSLPTVRLPDGVHVEIFSPDQRS